MTSIRFYFALYSFHGSWGIQQGTGLGKDRAISPGGSKITQPLSLH